MQNAPLYKLLNIIDSIITYTGVILLLIIVFNEDLRLYISDLTIFLISNYGFNVVSNVLIIFSVLYFSINIAKIIIYRRKT